MAAKKGKGSRRSPGEGSVYDYPKGSGKWFAQEWIDGKLTRRRAPSEKAAEAKLRELQELKEKHIDIHTGAQTVETWMGTFHGIKVRLRKLSPRSINFNLDHIERYILPKIGDMRVSDVRPSHLQTVVDEVYSEIQAGGKYDGARTAQAVGKILQEAFTLAYEKKLVLENPYSGVVLPKYKRKRITPLDDKQLLAFMEAAAGRLDKRKRYRSIDGKMKRLPPVDPRFVALWHSYALLGWRRGEGLGARWSALDWGEGTITIDQQVQRVTDPEGKQIVIVAPPKTEDSERTLPLPRRLLSLYWDRWDDSQAERELRGWSIDTLIFPSQAGTPMWPDNLETMFRRIREAAGLPATFKLHHLRHTLATLVDECGATESLKQDILGHAKTTQSGKYTHGRIAAMRTVLQAVEDRILGQVLEKEETGT